MWSFTPQNHLARWNCYNVEDVNDAPIGVFDSGLGGLTVARAIIDQLPGEDVIYLGDSANTPYGSRRLSDVRALTLAGLDSLVEQGAKILVIACNTATAAALQDARERYGEQGIPVIEVVSPAAKQGAAITRNGRYSDPRMTPSYAQSPSSSSPALTPLALPSRWLSLSPPNEPQAPGCLSSIASPSNQCAR